MSLMKAPNQYNLSLSSQVKHTIPYAYLIRLFIQESHPPPSCLPFTFIIFKVDQLKTCIIIIHKNWLSPSCPSTQNILNHPLLPCPLYSFCCLFIPLISNYTFLNIYVFPFWYFDKKECFIQLTNFTYNS